MSTDCQYETMVAAVGRSLETAAERRDQSREHRTRFQKRRAELRASRMGQIAGLPRMLPPSSQLADS